MRKNYFKNLVTSTMMLLTLTVGFTSCEGTLDDIFGEWSRPTNQPQESAIVITPTSSGASVEVNNISNLTEALSSLKDQIAASSGSEYVIDVTSSLESTSGANEITVPLTDDSKVKLNLTNGISTTTPLTIKSESTATTPSAAKNELTIELPSNTDGKAISLNVDMPETTVTLKAASGNVIYDEVVVTTATNTFVVKSGNIIRTLIWKGGNIIVEDGGEIETLGAEGDDKNDSFEVGPSSMWTKLYKAKYDDTYQVFKNSLGGDAYMPENVKVCKGNLVTNLIYDANNNLSVNKLIIADGAAAIMSYVNAKAIEGDGSAKLYFTKDRYDKVNDYVQYSGSFFKYTTSIKGVSIEPYIADDYKDKENKTYLNINFPVENPTGEHTVAFTNCSFDANTLFEARLETSKIKRDENGNVVYGEVKIYWAIKDNGDGTQSRRGSQNKEFVLHDTGNPDVEVSEGQTGGYWTTKEYVTVEEAIQFSNYTGILEFNNCTLGGSAITSNTDLINWHNSLPDGASILVKINGTLYRIDSVTIDGKTKYVLIEA